jgi:hypothetical protein
MSKNSVRSCASCSDSCLWTALSEYAVFQQVPEVVRDDHERTTVATFSAAASGGLYPPLMPWPSDARCAQTARQCPCCRS